MEIRKINNSYTINQSNSQIAEFSSFDKNNDFHITLTNINLNYMDKVIMLFMKRLKNKMYNKLHLEIINHKNLKKFLNVFLHRELIHIKENNNTLQILIKLNNTQNNNVKIIPIWLGPRRKWSGDYIKNSFDLVKFIIYNEININKGISCDSKLIINMPYDDNVVNNTKHIRDFIYQFQNYKTTNGKIHVEERENIGISYGAFSYAFKKYQNIYDFWFFNEDDYIIDKHHYMINNYNQFRQIENNIGYIGESNEPCQNFPLTEYPTHVHFGLGFSSQQILKQLDHLAFMLSKTDSADNHHLYGEIPFTNDIYKLGYDLVPSQNLNCTIEWMATWQNSSKLKSFNESMRIDISNKIKNKKMFM